MTPGGVRTVAVVGTGVIGGGWAAHFLRAGLDVVAYDPGAGAASRLDALVDNAWPALERLGLAPGAARDRLVFAPSLAAALAGADFVQESAPEVLPAKVALLASLDALAGPGVVIASSTSGLLMSDMAVDCATPERLVVGHPFNPPYLLPVVEVVGGARTSAGTLAAAGEFYGATGKVVLRLDREVPGFVGNRLQEALWREALHMVAEGEATVQQIDDAITYGPGLRWAQMGPMLTFHLAGGPGGMGHMLDQFGPALLEPWTRLSAPELTPALRDAVVSGVQQEAGDRSVVDLEQQRDAFLVDLLLLLGKHRLPAQPPPGGVRTPYEQSAAAGWDPAAPVEAPLRLHHATVPPAWVDYNGHMSESCFLLAAGDCADAFFRFVGVDEAYRAAGHSLYTVQSHVHHLREAALGDRLDLALQLMDLDDRRIHVFTTTTDRATGQPVSTVEQLLVHVDTAAGRSTPFPPELTARLMAVLAAHANLPRPAAVGQVTRIRHRTP